VILAAGLDSRAYRLAWPDGTSIFELDRPQVLDFKREVLAQQGARPNAGRREIAIDLREDWPQALRDSGFDASKPSAWIAEGLLIYLPAAARTQLFTGIDALASSGSQVAVEESAALPAAAFQAAVEEERAARAQGENRLFFQLTYNEQHDPAQQWFAEHGWKAVATPLADYLEEVGRPVPRPDIEAGPMIARNTLVRAVKE
jgi:methyltransferase (TIGR00027 family)